MDFMDTAIWPVGHYYASPSAHPWFRHRSSPNIRKVTLKSWNPCTLSLVQILLGLHVHGQYLKHANSTRSTSIMPRVYPPIDGRTAANSLPPSVIETTAGFTAGIVSTLVVHPFDVIKTRLQVDRAASVRVGSSLRIAKSLARDEGLSRGFYRGLTPNIIGNSVSWALYFLWYAEIKAQIQVLRGGTRDAASAANHVLLKPTDYFLASGASGIITAVLTNPIWVIKTRMLSTARTTPGAYKSVGEGVTHIIRTEGPRGFYRGLLPSLFGVSHGAVQFMAYEQLKNWRLGYIQSRPGGAGELAGFSNWDYLSLSAVSKILAGSLTYPYQVVRARLQVYDAGKMYNGTIDVIKRVWRHEGLGGFYKGLGPNIVRVLPSTCVTFLVYENTKLYLPRFYSDASATVEEGLS